MCWKPWHPDPLPDPQAMHVAAHLLDPADNLVARHQRKMPLWQFAVDDVQVRAADAAGLDPQPDLVPAGLWQGKFRKLKRLTGRPEDHGAHRLWP